MRLTRTWLASTVLAALVLTLLPSSAFAAPTASGRYIVVFHPRVRGVERQADRLAHRHEGRGPDRLFRHAIKGFSMRMSARAAEAMERDAMVAYVEPVRPVRALDVQTSATWGLDRIDQRDLPLGTEYSYTSSGSGVTAYVIDTGIRTTHDEFGTRASAGFDAFDDGQNGEDCDGHGTHVAGTIGGSTYGVAKAVSLVAVRVLDCTGAGTTETVIAGVEWVTANATAPAVANMSLGSSFSQAVNDAVGSSISEGITYVSAAGNGDSEGNPLDACGDSPGSLDEIINVSATNSSDSRESWANYGTCVDLFAPGISITSAGIVDDTDTDTQSGTSMASPHVAGVAARYLGTNTTATPAAVTSAILASASVDKLSNIETGSPNLLLYSEQLAPGAGETLTVARAGTGAGTVTSSPAGIACGSVCAAEYATETTVTLTATAAEGSSFNGWSGACTGTSTCVVTLNADATVTATFSRAVPILRDLGFELGSANPYWNIIEPDFARISSVSRLSGTYAGDMCGANDCYGSVYQELTVPQDVQSAVLSYSYRGTTSDTPDGCWDSLAVGVAQIGAAYGPIAEHCNALADGKWRSGSVDMTTYLQEREGDQVAILADVFTDNIGPTRFFVDNLNLKIATTADSTAPTVSWGGIAPATFQKQLTLPLSWSGSDTAGPLGSFDVRYRRAAYNSAFGTHALWRFDTQTTSGTFTAAAGYTYCFSLRARDMLGNESAWSAERCTAFPVNDRTLTRSGSWTNGTGSAYYLSTYTRATARGASLSRSVAAKRIALVATRCSTCGTVEVYLGTTLLRRMSLYSSTTQRKQVLSVASFTTVKTGTLKIKVYTSGKPVIIEGLGIRRT